MTTVDPDKYYAVAKTLINASNDIAGTLSSLDGNLRVARSAGAHNPSGPNWATSYDQAAWDVFELGSLCAIAARELGYAVHEQGINYALVEHEEPVQPPQGTSLVYSMRPKELSVGGTGDKPNYFEYIAEYVEKDWADCDPDKIKHAGEWLELFGTSMLTKSSTLYGEAHGKFPADYPGDVVGIDSEVESLCRTYWETGFAATALASSAKSVGTQSTLRRSNASDAALAGMYAHHGIEVLTTGAGLFKRIPGLRRISNELKDAAIRNAARNFDSHMRSLDDDVTNAISSNSAIYATVTTASDNLASILDRVPRRVDRIGNPDLDRDSGEVGASGERSAGIDPDPSKKTTLSINGHGVIPDRVDDANHQITEVKNSNHLNQRSIDQLKDMSAWAEAHDYTVTLVVDHRTTIAPDIQALIDAGQIQLIRAELDDNDAH